MTGWPEAVAAAASMTFATALVMFALYSLDDVALLVAFVAWRVIRRFRRRDRPLTAALLAGEPERRIAVLVPAWDESDVIQRMLRAMLARYQYRNYRVFVGVYPNDPATRHEVESVAAEDARVACIVVARPGPTTKGDCLNQLYAAVLRDGDGCGQPYEIFVLNDAEDVVPPLGLRVFSRFIPEMDVVQLPVLPLRVHWSNLTAWHYADEFAVAHARDMPVRAWLSGAVPSAGVGTGFSSRALARAAGVNHGLPFSMTSLTEDYDLTMRIAAGGYPMTFVIDALFRPEEDRTGRPIDDAIGVREYFPRTFRRAVRQKSRWIAGIVLQGWAQLGWGHRAALQFFFFRDRKILFGYVAMALGYISLALAALVRVARSEWPDVIPIGPWMGMGVNGAMALMILLLVIRAAFVGAVYGFAQAAWSPVRAVWGGFINMLAAGRAIWIVSSQARPRWDKTAHEFPELTT